MVDEAAEPPQTPPGTPELWDPWEPASPADTAWWTRAADTAKALGSDGCTGVSQLFSPCCQLHDILYRAHVKTPAERKRADRAFLKCMQAHSRFGRWAPLAWIRYGGVRLFGRFFYRPSV